MLLWHFGAELARTLLARYPDCAFTLKPMFGEQALARTSRLLQHDFACPARGRTRGAHSDGWREDELPRRIRYWVDDLQVLLSLVKAGLALAYLPDFSEFDTELVRIQVSDCRYTCTERLF